MKKIRIKKKTFIIITLFLILFLFLLLLKYYQNNNTKLNKIAYEKLNDKISKTINRTIYPNIKNNGNLIHLYKDETGNILYLDYDLDKTYQVIDQVTKRINKEITHLEHVYIKVPFNATQNIAFYDLIPKIYINIYSVNSIIANIDTKVTEYGLNNALVQLFITLKIDCFILTGINEQKVSFNYKTLLDSKIISGKVPSFYGGDYSSSSKIFDIPIK